MTWVLVYWVVHLQGGIATNHIKGFETKKSCSAALTQLIEETRRVDVTGICLSERVR